MKASQYEERTDSPPFFFVSQPTFTRFLTGTTVDNVSVTISNPTILLCAQKMGLCERNIIAFDQKKF
jgi:hypothetical protein